MNDKPIKVNAAAEKFTTSITIDELEREIQHIGKRQPDTLHALNKAVERLKKYQELLITLTTADSISAQKAFGKPSIYWIKK